jgi:hypothetical protein
MVNPGSSTFKFFEKIGLLIGKGIRIVVVGGAIIALGGKLKGTSSPTPPPPPPPPSP